jgi:hypothetical protein
LISNTINTKNHDYGNEKGYGFFTISKKDVTAYKNKMTLVLHSILRFHIKNLTFAFAGFKMKLSRGGQAHNATPGAASPEHTNAKERILHNLKLQFQVSTVKLRASSRARAATLSAGG